MARPKPVGCNARRVAMAKQKQEEDKEREYLAFVADLRRAEPFAR